MIRACCLSAVFSLCLLMAGCASQKEREAPHPEVSALNRIEPQAQPLFQKAEKAFTSKNYEQARKLYQNVRTRFPHSRADMLATYRLGTIYYYRQQYPNASREFDSVLHRFP